MRIQIFMSALMLVGVPAYTVCMEGRPDDVASTKSVYQKIASQWAAIRIPNRISIIQFGAGFAHGFSANIYHSRYPVTQNVAIGAFLIAEHMGLGKFCSYACTHIDGSEQKNAQNFLQESQKRAKYLRYPVGFAMGAVTARLTGYLCRAIYRSFTSKPQEGPADSTQK